MNLRHGFCSQSDPRFLSTLKQVLKSPERGGLTSNVREFDVVVACH